MTNRACPDGLDPAAAVLAVVASIPCGRVATYGQVAVLAGLGRAARFVAPHHAEGGVGKFLFEKVLV